MVCAADYPHVFKTMRKGCHLQIFGDVVRGAHGSTYASVAVPFDTVLPFAHGNCLCNQVIAVTNRVLAAVPQPLEAGVKELQLQAQLLARLLPRTYTAAWDVLPSHYSGAKAAKYQKAVDKALRDGVTRRDAGVTMFVKFEKVSGSKENPDPRAIQFRDPVYCVEIARYLKPIERHLYDLEGGQYGFPVGRLVGKGMNSVERARTLHEKWGTFRHPVALVLDASRFDLHCSVPLLELEHSVYLACNNSVRFRELLSWQLTNHGRSREGVKYVSVGGRMSGDMNTALGNCIIMILMVSAAFRHVRYQMLDDGDDCVVIVEHDQLTSAVSGDPDGDFLSSRSIADRFLAFGHEIKVEMVTDNFNQISWCQCSPVQWSPGRWKMVRDPWRTMTNALMGGKFKDVGRIGPLINTIGYAETILNLGVPVLQEWALALVRNSGTEAVVELSESDGLHHRLKAEMRLLRLKGIKDVRAAPITEQARLSFSEAFGIPVHEQLSMEAALAGWVFSIGGWCGEVIQDPLPGLWERSLRRPDVHHLRDA